MFKPHDWVAIVTIYLNDSQAEQMFKTGRLNESYHKEEQDTDVGCYTCEQPLGKAWGKPCPGEPEE